MIMIGRDIYELDTKQKPLWGTVLKILEMVTEANY